MKELESCRACSRRIDREIFGKFSENFYNTVPTDVGDPEEERGRGQIQLTCPAEILSKPRRIRASVCSEIPIWTLTNSPTVNCFLDALDELPSLLALFFDFRPRARRTWCAADDVRDLWRDGDADAGEELDDREEESERSTACPAAALSDCEMKVRGFPPVARQAPTKIS